MNHVGSIGSHNSSRYVDTSLRERRGRLQWIATGIAQFLGVVPYPETARTRAGRQKTDRDTEHERVIDWHVTEFSIHQADPKNFIW